MLIDSTKRQMIAVAAVACGFAVGMAGLLNYFKYRSTSNRIITERLVVTGRSVETVVQLALDLGLEFSEISTLPATLERERTTDDLITGIDIFDNDGKLLYSTETQRSSRPVPVAWLEAVAAAHGKAWMVEGDVESAAGMSLKTTFGVTLAHLALRYSGDGLRVTDREVAREIALNALIVLLSSSLLSSLALLAVMRRLTLDMNDAEAALRSGDAVHGARGPFGAALVKFIRSTHDVEREIADLSARAEHGAKS
jgi:hypothetical protein